MKRALAFKESTQALYGPFLKYMTRKYTSEKPRWYYLESKNSYRIQDNIYLQYIMKMVCLSSTPSSKIMMIFPRKYFSIKW